MIILKVIFIFTALVIFADASAVLNGCQQPPDIRNGSYKMENDTAVTYSCNKNYQLIGEKILICRNGKWDELPKCIQVRKKSAKIRTKGKKKYRNQKIKALEEVTIDENFANTLDLSCIKKGLIRAPALYNASIVKYARRKKNGHIFITVEYSCEEGFEFENPEENKLYCRQKSWIGNQPNCKLVDRKETNLSFACNRIQEGCEHECLYAKDKVLCTCYEGFILDKNNGKKCLDINECAKNNGGCEGICINTPGSHECTCSVGLQIDSVNGRSCIDINECLLNNGHGPCQDSCHNSWGSYSCSCGERDGLRGTRLAGDGHTCLSSGDDCLSGAAGCSHDCINLPLGRGAYCSCPDGWRLMDDWKTCQDINECEELLINCTNCLNTEGSYECYCPEGYNLATDGISCDDINECQLDLELCSEGCMNTGGSYICLCPDGYYLKEDKKSCEDIDECMQPDICGFNEFCSNTQGNFICACKNGFRRFENGLCSSIDLCKYNNGGCSHNCFVGEYDVICSCPDGYVLSNDNMTCEDFNECFHKLDNCEQICENVIGSFICRCKSGFVLNEDNTTCEDINECSLNNGGCSHNCINLISEFRCSCPDTHTLGYDGICELIDSCSLLNGGCSHECKFIQGETSCFCPVGYELQIDNKTCTDKNECLTENGGCSDICINLPGNWRCECAEGHSLSRENMTCVDIDECILQNPCSHNCSNTKGGYECLCPKGYELSHDLVTCTDVNECLYKNGGCSDICVNHEGTFECSCRNGYELKNDKRTCRIVDKCANMSCSHRCRTVNGKAECYCKRGYKLANDSITCEAVKCPKGYILGKRGQSCIKKYVECPPLPLIDNGNVTCSQDHRSFHKTCLVVCTKGFELQGPSTIFCNSSFGVWNVKINQFSCVRKFCPKLPKLKSGSYLPEKCNLGEIYPNEKCRLICNDVYKLSGPSEIQCMENLQWNYNITSECEREKEILKPFIRCPRDLKLAIRPNQDFTRVRIPRPKSNVDWWRYVDAFPSWGKQLEGEFPPGITVITFQARSPTSNLVDVCRVIIDVKVMEPLFVKNCPTSFEVFLQPNEDFRSISWPEPQFEPNHQVANLFKSQTSGEIFYPGLHQIKYIASDSEGYRVQCDFTINIKDKNVMLRDSLRAPRRSNNHFLICDGKPPQRISTLKTIRRTPKGCVVRQIRNRQKSLVTNLYSRASNNFGFAQEQI